MKIVIAFICVVAFFLGMRFLMSPSKEQPSIEMPAAFSWDNSYDKAQKALEEQNRQIKEQQKLLQQERLKY